MGWYARPSLRLVGQIVADVLVLAWAAAWWFASRFVDAAIRAIAVPARSIAQVGTDLQGQLGDAATQVAALPVVGGQLQTPFDQMRDTLAGLITSANDQAASIETVATIVGWSTFLVPALLVVMMWLPARLRFASRALATRELAASASGTDLLALRALMNQPLSELRKVASDPMDAWRDHDADAIRKLAALELAAAGVKAPRKHA